MKIKYKFKKKTVLGIFFLIRVLDANKIDDESLFIDSHWSKKTFHILPLLFFKRKQNMEERKKRGKFFFCLLIINNIFLDFLSMSYQKIQNFKYRCPLIHTGLFIMKFFM